MAYGGETPSEVHRNFVRESMGKRPIIDVPGIGEVLGKNMKETGIHTARQLLGHFLISRTDKDFKDLIKQHGGNAGHQTAALNAMKDFTRAHI